MKTFPVGYFNFNENNIFNFQMNRWYSFGFISYDEMVAAGKRIHNFEDWIKVFLDLADQAQKNGNMLACATYLRAAQFFALGDTRDENGELLTISLYEKCMSAYELAYKNEAFEYVRIPYETGYFPVIYKKHKNNSSGSVVIHGGYDSFIQEFVPMLSYAYERGFDVYLFEGSGQGEVLNRCGLKMTPDWENCTSPVLDYFGLENVTLIGISLGGYLAARAAAFEPRIKRVVLYDIIYDFYASFMSKSTSLSRIFIDLLLKHEKCFLWSIIEKKANQNYFARWLLEHGCHVFGVQNLPQYLNHIKAYNTRDLSSKIRQDVLLLAGSEDIYTVFFDQQKQALTSAKSVEGRIFTAEENASHHCQVGNIGLVLDYIFSWIERKQ